MKRGVVVSAGLPVAACNKYYGIGLVVIKHVCVKTKKGRLYCSQCGLNVNKRVLQTPTSKHFETPDINLRRCIYNNLTMEISGHR